MDDVAWLRDMLARELEVRPPRAATAEARALAGDCITLRREARLVAFAEIRRLGPATEISTVLVDPDHRGQGLGVTLIEKAMESIETPMVFSATKHPAMARTLERAGFTRVRWPGTRLMLHLIWNTLGRMFEMLWRLEFRRIWVQGRSIFGYTRYMTQR